MKKMYYRHYVREDVKKIFFIMRIAVIMLFVMLFQAGAVESYAHTAKVSVKAEQVTLPELFALIEKQSEFLFFYVDADVENIKVKVNVRNKQIHEVLAQALKDTELTYTINNRNVNIIRKQAVAVVQQNRIVTGVITDAVTNEPIIGANVIVKGTTTGTVSDVDGKYSIEVASNATVLQISYIGYLSKEVPVGNSARLNIQLSEDAKMLEEVVVLGYGATARKADLSAAIGIVANLETLKNRPITSATSLLQGQIPGVTVLNNGGAPSDGPTVVIRGKGSQKDENVLWVVDGVPGGPIALNEIESMVVLKDAASAAIYGAHSGAAGVILVTTKKGKAGKPSITYEGSYGLSTATNLPQSLTAEEERAMRTASYGAAGYPVPDGWDVNKNPYIATTRTDWMDEVFRTSPYQRHYVSLNSGTDRSTNKLSVQYTDNQGTIIDTWSKDMRVRYDGMYQLSKHVRIREDATWSTGQSRNKGTDSAYDGIVFAAMAMPRNAEAYFADGTFGGTASKDPAYAEQYGSNYSDIHGDITNPLYLLTANTERNQPSYVMSSSFLDILDPLPGLKFTSRFTYKLDYGISKTFNPRNLSPGKPNMYNTLDYSANRAWKWESENTLNYDAAFGDHQIGALLSTTANAQRGYTFNIHTSEFESEQEIYQYLSYGTGAVTVGDSYDDPDNNVSAVGRLSYTFANRYFVTGSFRRDYAGRLPAGKKYGDFPAVTAAWKLSEESFFPKTDAMSLLKLRGSWGRIGNLGSIATAYGNPTLSLYPNQSGFTSGSPLGTGAMLTTAFNPFLTWETSEQTDFGLDADLLNNRLSVSVDWFNKRTFNLIKAQDLGWPTYLGLSAKTINEGEIRNTGWEFTLGWNDTAGKDWNYFINANLSTLNNRVSDIGAADPATGNKPVWRLEDSFRSTVLAPFRTIEGEPLNSYWLVKSAGLFQTDAEAAAYVDKNGNRIQPNAQAGDLKFIDQLTVDTNGDGIPDEADGKINEDDRVQMGAYFPKVTYALTGGFTWKDLSFSIMLQGVGGVNLFNGWKYMTVNDADGNFNRSRDILNAWPNSQDIPRLTKNDLNSNFGTCSDWYLEDASYLRIKNINLAYSLDRALASISPTLRERTSALSVYMSIDNLYTFTKYTGMDPEIGGLGLDRGKYPVPRIISFGVKLTY